MVLSESILARLMELDDWGRFAPLISSLKGSPYWPVFLDALGALNTDALYISHVHGTGHIERTMLHGALCAMSDALSIEDARLLMLMCSYHDTGRISDWLDNAHGQRSAVKLPGLTGLEGEDLKIAMAGVEAHSLGDNAMDAVIAAHAPSDRARARVLAELLKDADGLDRVRIHDLDTRFLRREASRERADFAQYLFDKYTALSPAGEAEKADGFELSTIAAVKRLVSESFSGGLSCAQTVLTALGNLMGVVIHRQLLDACAGMKYSRCGMVQAGLMMIGIVGSAAGRDNEFISDIGVKYCSAFEKQYGSLMCSELSSRSGLSSCESLAAEAILFSSKFIADLFPRPVKQ